MIHTKDKVIKHKVGLLNLAEELGNVSKACKMMGLSRDTFYRYKDAVDEGGVDALLERNRRSPNLKNRIDPAIESVVVEYALEEPAHGQTRTSNELRKRGTFVSPSGVRSIWLRHNLACFKDRLKALSDKVAEDGLILTESQVAAMERKRLAVKSKRSTQAILARKIRITWVHSRVLVVCINKPSLIRIARSLTRSSTRPRHQLRRPICSTIRCYHSTRNTSFLCCAFLPIEVPNTVVEPISMTTNSILRSMISSTRKLRLSHRKQTVSANVFTRRF